MPFLPYTALPLPEVTIPAAGEAPEAAAGVLRAAEEAPIAPAAIPAAATVVPGRATDGRVEPPPGCEPAYIDTVPLSEYVKEPKYVLTVKNTFVEVEEQKEPAGFDILGAEEQDDGPAVAACKSWCAGFMRVRSASWSCGSTSDGESTTAPSSPGGAARPGLSAEPPSPPPSPHGPARQPQASVGADLHGTGTCRPCGWFWKPEGCVYGAECGHCHMCPEGELKARKKARLATMRTRKRAERANDSQ